MFEIYAATTEKIKNNFRQHLENQRGAGALEYGLVLAVIVVIIISAAMLMEGPIQSFFQDVMTRIRSFW
ncbi:MAG: Flp family type IVb pilin [Desulfobacteraceae bacterium]|nr:MAG: Flp family type IVb pilin [Desulfobacteraceae bacterium]